VFFHVFLECLGHMFQVCYLFSLYVVTLAYGYFKSRSGLAHGDACEK
jgi:hypothetical protein